MALTKCEKFIIQFYKKPNKFFEGIVLLSMVRVIVEGRESSVLGIHA